MIKNEFIKVSGQEFTAKITLSKPPLNILGIEELFYFQKVLKDLNKQTDLKLIIIESDQKVFSAGVDVSDHSKDKFLRMLSAFHEVFITLSKLEIPTMSLIKSGCFGGGCELALFCDLVIASENTSFCQPEIKIGCFPPISMVQLPKQVGDKKALEIILSGDKISAKEALNSGLINHVFNEEEFESKSSEIINSITSNSSSVIKATLRAYKKINHSDLEEKLKLAEKFYIEELMNLEDAQEGIKSFLEKRPPLWKNR